MLGCLLRPLLPLSGSSGFPGCVRILNKKGKARSKLIFQHREEMLFPASYKTGANKTDTGAHCPANNVVMGDGRLRKQTPGRPERLIFPRECECESRVHVAQARRAGRGAAPPPAPGALLTGRETEPLTLAKAKRKRKDGERIDV